jgi:hypothetical protein
LVCEEEELPGIVQKIKSMSARACNIAMGRTIPAGPGTRDLAPLSGETKCAEWGACGERHNTTSGHKSSVNKEITSDEQLQNTIEYIRNNRKKHGLDGDGGSMLPRRSSASPEQNKGASSLDVYTPPVDTPFSEFFSSGSKLAEITKRITCTRKHAFRTEYKGGFDVVIGNPPYVRAELLGDFRGNLEKNYSVYNPAGDLFSYFYEKSFQLLKTNGLFGFISNTFDKTSAGVSVREFLQNKVQFLKYIDFTEVQIFEGATTYPVIIIAKNQNETNQPFIYIKIPKSSQSVVIDIDFHNSVLVSQNSLNKENWSFKSNRAVGLVDKLQKNKTIREIYGKSFRGILTGLNEAFIFPKTYQVGKHIKPIFEGKELEKWSVLESVQQLILFESRWTKENYGADITETLALEHLKKDFPELMNHILPFEERARKRFDQGDFFWELRNCAYYDLFEKPKIVFPNLQNSNKFAFDETGAYINAPAVILPTYDKFVTAILNSKLVWYFLTSICVVRNGGYIEVKPQYFEQIPIPEISEEKKQELQSITNQIINKTSEKQKVQTQFLKLLESKIANFKINKKLENWHELEFKDFLKELQKAKIKLSLSEEAQWMDYFNEQKQKAQTLKFEIDKTTIGKLTGWFMRCMG